MASKSNSRSRNKKVFAGTLGKAPCFNNNGRIDFSHIRKPIDTSIFGLNEVLKLMNTATDEVRQYITCECDIIYECRICRSIYRSLGNFVLHKRSYCTESYKPSTDARSFSNFHVNTPVVLNQSNIMDYFNSCINPVGLYNNYNTESSHEAAASNTRSATAKKKELDVLLQRLNDKQESTVITEQCSSEELSNESHYSRNEISGAKNSIAIQNLNSSGEVYSSTVFSRLIKNPKTDLMNSEVMEIHDILNDNEAIIGADGKILFSDTEKNSTLKNNYACGICSQKFSTKSSLTYHIRWKHNNSKLIYSCTECKEKFPFAWCVFRHLIKVHHKSTTQVRKIRNLVHNSAVKRCDVLEQKSTIVKKNNSGLELSESATTDDQQWISNLEGDYDLQRCGGCGRKFERKAALNSHAQICMKRIAICKSLKDTTGKKVVPEDKSDQVVKTVKKDADVVHMRRRKPLVVRKIYKYDISSLEEIIGPLPHKNIEETINVDSSSDSETTVKKNPENIPMSDQSDIFYIGNIVSSKVFNDSNDNEKISTSDIGNGSQIKENPRDDLNMESELEDSLNMKSKEKDEISKEEKLEDNFNEESKEKDEINEEEKLEDNLNEESKGEDEINEEEKLEDDLNEESNLQDKLNEEENEEDYHSNQENQLEDNVHKENQIDDSDKTETNIIHMIHTDESVEFNESEQEEIQTDNLIFSTQPTNDNVNSNSSFEPDSIDMDEISPMDITCDSKSNLTDINKPKISLARESLQYIDVEKQTCLPCQKPFNTHKDLMNHMASHFNWYRYHCNICKYLSYTKSKCKRHVISKHSIRDKIKLRNTVSRIPRSKVRESATSFTEHYKTRTAVVAETCVNVTIDQPECDENLDAVPIDPFGERPTNGTSIRDMVMEVIFGTSQSISEEIPVAIQPAVNGDVDSSIDDVLINDEESNRIVPQNVIAPKKVITSDPPQIIRPVRRRIIPVNEDFLYDMKHVLKLKRSRDRKLPCKTKLHSKSIKLSERRVSYNSPINTHTSSNSVQLENLNSDVNSEFHVTGEV